MADAPRLLAVDHNRRNLELLTQFLSREGYQIVGVASLEEFDRVLKQAKGIALALVDLAGFDQHIWERCDRLRKAKIPFLLISPKQLAAVQQAGVAHGARGVLTKPLVARELLKLIRSLLEE